MTAMSAPAASALVTNPARRECPLNTLASKPANSALAFTISAREQLCEPLLAYRAAPRDGSEDRAFCDAGRVQPRQDCSHAFELRAVRDRYGEGGIRTHGTVTRTTVFEF